MQKFLKQIASDERYLGMHLFRRQLQIVFAAVAVTSFATAVITADGAGAENKTIENDDFDRKLQQINEAVQAKEKAGFPAMFSEFDRGVRRLLDEFPHDRRLPDVLVRLASISPEAAARELTRRALDIDPNDAKAKVLQIRLDAVGKPFLLKFKALDGSEIDVATLRGKVVLIDFWATWCGPCVKEVPKLQEIYGRLHPKGLEILGFSLDYNRQKLQSFVNQYRIPWPQHFDGKAWDNEVIRNYGIIVGIPATFLVDKKGLLRKATLQPNLETTIKELLAE